MLLILLISLVLSVLLPVVMSALVICALLIVAPDHASRGSPVETVVANPKRDLRRELEIAAPSYSI